MVEVSVIIPIYNKEKYLNSLWQDLLNQSFRDFECILIDDGSTDLSGRLCDDIAKQDARFIVFHIKNNGVSNARNFGLDHANGRYITFIDADDRIHKNYIENLYECITKNAVEFVISGIEKKWENKTENEKIRIPYVGVHERDEYMPNFMQTQLQTGIYGFCVAKMIDKNIIRNIRFNKNIKLAEDLEFYLSLYPNVNKIYFDDKYYYYYLQEAQNSSMQIPDHKIDYFTQLTILKKMYQMLENMHFLKDENQKLLAERMNDYIFFTLFHAPRNEIKEYCKKIRILNIEVVVKKQCLFIQKIILKLFQRKNDNILLNVIKLYRFIRRKNY